MWDDAEVAKATSAFDVGRYLRSVIFPRARWVPAST